MRRGLRASSALLALLLCSTPAFAETQFETYARLRAAAADASKAGDNALAERHLQAARRLFPHHPGLLVLLARAQAAQGHASDAAAVLDRLAREGMVYDISADRALASLNDLPAMAPVLARMRLNARPVGRLTRSHALAGAGRPVEGAAYDAATGRQLFASVGGRGLTALTTDGKAEPFGSLVAEGGLYGLAVDAPRGLLWATEASGPGLPGGGPSATALLRLDLGSGALRDRYRLPLAGAHQLGDLTVGPDGTVYATDAAGGGIYRLRPGAAALEPLLAPGALSSPQGLAVLDKGRALVVADYPTGLHRLDLATGAIRRLAEPADVTLVGLDGVARDGEELILTQNGTAPQRVLRVRLTPGAGAIASVRVLVASPALAGGEPDISLGTVAGRSFVFVARSGWAAADDKGGLSPADMAAPAEIGWLDLEGQRP